MSKSITLSNGFAGLKDAWSQLHTEDPAEEDVNPAVRTGGSDAQREELSDLRADLQRGLATLAAIIRSDDEKRTRALSALEEYDLLVDQLAQAETVGKGARQMCLQAANLSRNAWDDENRDAAAELIPYAERLAETTAGRIERYREDLNRLRTAVDIERLLRERRRLQDIEQRRAADAERARRRSEGMAAAGAALAAGRIEEAAATLNPIAAEHPNDAEIGGLMESIRLRDLEARSDAAERAVWSAWREHRQDPVTAVARLETLDLRGLPPELVKLVFGAWLRASERLCRSQQLYDAVWCGAGFGRGFVAARQEPDEPHLIVCAIGGCGQVGAFADARLVQAARPFHA